jgi:hypothetical protein
LFVYNSNSTVNYLTCKHSFAIVQQNFNLFSGNNLQTVVVALMFGRRDLHSIGSCTPAVAAIGFGNNAAVGTAEMLKICGTGCCGTIGLAKLTGRVVCLWLLDKV